MKYKLYDTQTNEYKTNYKYNLMIYEDLEEIKSDLKNFHSIDNGGLTEKEFESLTLDQIVDLFGWKIEKAYYKNNQSHFGFDNEGNNSII